MRIEETSQVQTNHRGVESVRGVNRGVSCIMYTCSHLLS